MESVAWEKDFDLVLFMDVVEHIPDWKSVLSGLMRYVKPGGYLYIQAPSNYPSPNWPTFKIYKNRFLGFLGKNNPSKHVRHGMSCKTLLDFCSPWFVPLVAAEGYVAGSKVYCSFKPRTHLLLRKN
jgi:2-polyprenyl-3-methyl-5-hydroxy-6-metoxy-1,4-benzoquinol methylase